MGKYSIKDLERLSGIKAHTIRIWEKRYNIITPERSETNIRLYCDSDLRRLLNISILNNNGYKISRIATLQNEEMSRKVMEVCEDCSCSESEIDRLIVSMVDLNERKFEQIIQANTLQVGFLDTMTKVVFPFLQKIGIMWQTGSINPAQEHFITNLIRQKLVVAIDRLSTNPPSQPKGKFLLFLPEGDLHEMGLLFYNYLLRKNSYDVVYLGQSVPFEDLNRVCRICSPDHILTTVTGPLQKMELETYINFLRFQLEGVNIFVSLPENTLPDLEMPKNTHRIGPKTDIFSILAD